MTVSTAAGKVAAIGRGRSSLVDWTWSSAKAGKGPFRWRVDAGPSVLPAEGTFGGTLTTPPPPAPAPKTPTTQPTVPAVPVTPAPKPTPVVPVTTVVTGLTVSPATLTPSSTGTGLTATVGFSLSTVSDVTVTVTPSPTGVAVLTLLSTRLPAGPSTHAWDIGILPNGRYKLIVAAIPVGQVTPVAASVDVTVDRTLGAFLATPAAFSPNGDGVNDTMTLSFQLTQSASVQVAIQRNGVNAATVFSAQLPPGTQTIAWDGTSAGIRLPDGDYIAVVTATTVLGTVSLLQPLTIDTTAPVLSVVDGATLRFDLSEAATVTAVVNGQSIAVSQPRAPFQIPWTAGPVTSFTVQARDAAGNAGPRSAGPEQPRVVALLEPVEDLDQQLEPVAVDRAGSRPRRACRR